MQKIDLGNNESLVCEVVY
ncbi:DUF1391 family protein [Escherichia coli]|nr:YdaF family protein [Escherichia coli]